MRFSLSLLLILSWQTFFTLSVAQAQEDGSTTLSAASLPGTSDVHTYGAPNSDEQVSDEQTSDEHTEALSEPSTSSAAPLPKKKYRHPASMDVINSSSQPVNPDDVDFADRSRLWVVDRLDTLSTGLDRFR